MKHWVAVAAVLGLTVNLEVPVVAALGLAMAERLLSLHQYTVGMVIPAAKEVIFKLVVAAAVPVVRDILRLD